MNTRRLLIALLVALGCSALLTWQLSRHLPHAARSERPAAVRQVVVAAKTVPAGEPFVESSVSVIHMTGSQPIPGAFQSAAEVVARTAAVPINAGDLILAHDLSPMDAGTGLAVAITPGMRAVTVRPPDEMAGGSGFILPGSYVDVLVTYRSGIDDAFISSLVLQAAKVLAVGQNREAGGEDKARSDGAITLLLTPEEAARFTSASALGKVTLALRNGTDRIRDIGPMHVSFTRGYEERRKLPVSEIPVRRPESTKPSSAPEFRVETLVGGKTTTQTFQGEQ